MIKWLAAILGYSFLRFPGAILGFFIGSFIELLSKGSINIRTNSYSIKPEKFELNLLALSAMIIKADGKIEQKELSFVRNFFIAQYGKDRADSIFKTFNIEVKKEVQHMNEITSVFIQHTRYETRLQILHFLFGIANSDGSISNSELQKLSQIASGLSLHSLDFESIKAMFIKKKDNAFKILEVESNASKDEIKTAYPAMIKGAEEKFREVQKAYETLMNK